MTRVQSRQHGEIENINPTAHRETSRFCPNLVGNTGWFESARNKISRLHKPAVHKPAVYKPVGTKLFAIKMSLIVSIIVASSYTGESQEWSLKGEWPLTKD